MTLNYLLYRHQISQARARSAASREARTAHRGLAAGYAVRIRAIRADLGGAAVEPLRVT